MTIRPEEERDWDAIRQLVYDAFLNVPFHPPGALPTEHKIVDALRETGMLTLSLVAEIAGEVVGHVAFSPVRINGRASDWYGLGPVATRVDRHRQGIGGALIRAGLDAMQKRGAAGVVLLGDPAYYHRFGFRPDPRMTLEGLPPEYFMIHPFGPVDAAGVVTFDPAKTAAPALRNAVEYAGYDVVG